MTGSASPTAAMCLTNSHVKLGEGSEPHICTSIEVELGLRKIFRNREKDGSSDVVAERLSELIEERLIS